MRFSLLKAASLVLAGLTPLASAVTANDVLTSNSLGSCLDNSPVRATYFKVAFTPINETATFEMAMTTAYEGKVLFDIHILVYGYLIKLQADPCTISELKGMCPMRAGRLPGNWTLEVPGSRDKLPGIAYGIPDLDASVRIIVNERKDDGTAGGSIACIDTSITNGKTVDLIGVKWATAVVALLALASSAVISALGRPNTAAHIAANSLSLVGYFQAQAIMGQTGIHLPPLVSSWTQDFQWSMGIINVGFMQTIFTWYQRATGGSPSTLFQTGDTLSVHVQKRSLDYMETARHVVKRGVDIASRALSEVTPRAVKHILKRSGNQTDGLGGYVVSGIQRVAYRAGIESTNLFITGLVFFCIFAIISAILIVIFKAITNQLAKRGVLSQDRFLEFRSTWRTVLKGVLYRIAIITFPQMAVLCLWEFTQGDSPAEIVLAVFFLLGFLLILGHGVAKVYAIARASAAAHRNHAYALYSDPHNLTKYGALYVQFRASGYYFIAPLLAYILVKAMFVAFAQNSGITQAIAFIILEAAALITSSVMHPYMDKPTNSFNIAICIVNFLNAIALLIFTDVFDAPGLIAGVIGVVVFIMNAAFSLVLLLMIIISTTWSFFRKNSEGQYKNMADDRASFIRSQTDLNTTKELDALAATARGDEK